MTDTITRLTAADLVGPAGKALLALNNAHAEELSWLEPARLAHLVSEAFVARRIGVADALLLTFDQAADYDSPNFLWFRERYPAFVYVDRVVVTDGARGRGWRGGSMTTCSSPPVWRAMSGSSARSIPTRRIRPRRPSTPRWGSSRWGRRRSTAGRRR